MARNGLDCIETEYARVENLIWSMCNKFVRRYGGEIDEVKAQANLSFVIAYRKWDPAKGAAFSSWVGRSVWLELIGEIRRVAKRRKIADVRYKPDETLEQPVTWPSLNTLSDNANEIIRHLCTNVSRYSRLRGRRLEVLRSHFVENEYWWPSDFDEAFNEIEQEVRHEGVCH